MTLPRHPLLLTFAARAALGLAAATTLIGCSGANGPVPAGAVLGAEGNGTRVVYTTSTGGTAYVADATDHKLVWSGAVRDDQTITVDTTRNNITVDARTVSQAGLHAGHTYRVFLDPTIRR